MIPYIDIPSLKIPLPFGFKPLELHAFGALVLLGIVVGARIALKRARERGVSEDLMHTAIFWTLVAGFIGAHLVHVLFYYPQMIRENPLSLLMIWAGISSFGGFLGAFFGLYLFTRRYGQSFAKFTDLIMLGLVPGWVFGRMGCSVAHDHPGQHSDFFLAVNFPGGPRHDLGFYEFLFTLFVLLPAVEIFRRRPLLDGNLALIIGVIYAPYRFLIDFLRIDDKTYLGLTPAQYGCLLLFFGGLSLLIWRRKLPRPAPLPNGEER